MNRRAPHLQSFFEPAVTLRALALDAAFAARHPRATARLARRALRDRRAAVQLLRLGTDLETIRKSPRFDAAWLLERHPEWAADGLPPEFHLLFDDRDGPRLSSPLFSGAVYDALNPEAAAAGLHPLVHYEQYGRFVGCPASARDADPPPPDFPPAAVPLDVPFGPPAPPRHRRVALFAAFAPDGRLPEPDRFYLRALREVCDEVLLSVNSPLRPDEEGRLRGLADAVLARWHGGYDFGSWRLGLAAAREAGRLAPERCDELVFANSSCLAPVRPFAPVFRAMERRDCDFWGLTCNDQLSGEPHLQSFFLVFRRPVLDAGALDAFFASRPLRATRQQAIRLYEIQLTAFLRERGFRPGVFLKPSRLSLHRFNPTTHPLALVRRGCPVVKAKALRGESRTAPERVLACIRRRNPALGALLRVSEPPPPHPPLPAELAPFLPAPGP